MRERVGIERTILCATRFWGLGKPGPRKKFGKLYETSRIWERGETTPTLLAGVRSVVKKQGFSGPEVSKALTKLERAGFIKTSGAHSAKTIALTPKGGKVGCATVKLAPWTNDEYPGSELRGAGASCGCSRK